jgi:hypothetical protein
MFCPVQHPLPEHIELVHAFGEEFLKELTSEPISFVYLDNFDWDYWLGREEESFVPEVKERYKNNMGQEMTNINSQKAHLAQAMLLVPMMTDNSIIMCDDTWYYPEEGVYMGKCAAVIPYLMLHGYELLHSSGYRQDSGAILGKFKK